MRIATMKNLFTFALCLAFTQLSAAALKKGRALPSLKLPHLQKEGSFNPAALKGKVVVVDFWASWCGPCKIELPFLNEMYGKYKDKGLVVVGVNVDDDKSAATGFLKEHAVAFPILYDEGKKLIEKVQVSTMPTSFIAGKDGKVQFIHKGFTAEDKVKIEKQIVSLLGGK